MMNPMMMMAPMGNHQLLSAAPGGDMPQQAGAAGAAAAAIPQAEAAEEEAAPQARQPSLRERLGIGASKASNANAETVEADPEVVELCRHFKIEDRIRDRLNRVMMTKEGLPWR